MSLKQSTPKWTLALAATLITALLLTFTGPTFAKKGGNGGGGGGNGGGGGEDPPPEPSNLPEYEIAFIGDETTYIYDMNEAGDLVGETDTGLASPHDRHAFIDRGFGMEDLHVLADPGPDVVLRMARAVNDTGQVAIRGWRDLDGDGEFDVWAGFRLTLDDGFGPLLEGLELSDTTSFDGPVDMNDDGDIIGAIDGTGYIWSNDGDGDGVLDAVALPFGARPYDGGITNRALDGIVQITGNTDDVYERWRWSGNVGGIGVLEDLGGFGGYGGGYGINDLGDVVGSISYGEPGFRYTDDGGFEVIGQLVTNPKKGELSSALPWSINNLRETVGWAWKGRTAGTNENTIFLHSDDFGTIDLAPQITGWSGELTAASSFQSFRLSINDVGEIAGNSEQGAFFLTPVPVAP